MNLPRTTEFFVQLEGYETEKSISSLNKNPFSVDGESGFGLNKLEEEAGELSLLPECNS